MVQGLIKLGFRVRFKLAGVGWGENRQLHGCKYVLTKLWKAQV